MNNTIMHQEGTDSWISWIQKRIRNNLNFLAIAEGPTGAGKSWAMLSVAHKIDPDFNAKEQIAFSFKELMRIINKFNDKTTELSKRKYKVIIFDEAQTDLSNREWQSKVNKLFNYLLSTFRHQNIILLFTSPYSDFIDSASMKLVHCKFEIRGWNKKTGKTKIRPKILQYNSTLKKTYNHSLYVIHNRKMNKLVYWFVKAPPQHLIEPYEAMKTAFTQRLNKEITDELENEGKDEKEEKEAKRILTPTQQRVYDLYLEGKDTKQTALDMGLSRQMIYKHYDLIKKKGYEIVAGRHTL